MSEKSKRRREGREAFAPGGDPMDYHPYNREDWEFDFKFAAFCEGWNNAKAEYYEEEAQQEEMDERLRMCPWHVEGDCLGHGDCSEDGCPILYWRDRA